MSHHTLLKTREVAQAMGVSVSTIKRWVDSGSLSAARTVGKHRLIEVAEALRFAREQDLPHAKLQILLKLETPDQPFSVDRSIGLLTDALEKGLAADARGIIGEFYARSREAAYLGDALIRPVMERIGQKWQDGTLDIYEEHRASRIVEAALMELTDRVASTNPAAAVGLAMGASPEGDLSTLSSALCEFTLRELGWDVMNLGPHLPLASFAAAVRADRPKLVWLSVNHLEDEEQFIRDYQAFYDAASSVGTAICLGGLALTQGVRARLVAASFGERMSHLAEFARRLVPESDRKPGKTVIHTFPKTSTNEG